MSTSTKLEPSILLPGTQCLSRFAKLKVKQIPALDEIMGSGANPECSAQEPFTPLSTLVVTQNPDNTYAVLNDLELIAPEARRIASQHVWALVVQFNNSNARDEDLMRRHLAFVEPSRCARSHSEFVAATQRGVIDGLPELYVGDHVDPRGYVAVSAILPSGQLARSTFQRIRKSFLSVATNLRRKTAGEIPRRDASPPIDTGMNPIDSATTADKEATKKKRTKQTKESGGQGELF